MARQKQEIDPDFGARLQRARELSGYTREQFAELVGCSSSFLADVERGNCNVSLPILKRICEALHIASDTLLWAEPDRPNGNYRVGFSAHLSDDNMARLNNIAQIFVDAQEPQT